MKTLFFLLCPLILSKDVVSQGIVIIEPESGTESVTSLITEDASSVTSSPNISSNGGVSSGSTIEIIDFISFDVALHEAEFIFRFTPSNSANDQEFVLGPHRSLALLQEHKQLFPSPPGSPLPLESRLVKVYKVGVKCKTFLALFPHDSHVCNLILKHGAWSEKPASICGNLKSYDFHTKGYLPVKLPFGTVLVSIIIERTSGLQTFGQMYSPLIMLVCISFFTLSKRGSFTFRIWSSMACFLGLLIITTLLWDDIPRAGQTSGQTSIEHYFVICVGIVFQIVLTNILAYRYLSPTEQIPNANGENIDVESNGIDSPIKGNEIPNLKVPAKIKPDELHILRMGKWHQFLYFKCIKPAKYHLPIAFLVLNVIYWVIIIWMTSGLPKEFQSPPESKPVSPLDFSCI